MKRVPPSKRTREAINELFAGAASAGDPRSDLIRLAVQFIVEEGMEAVVRDHLGREYYERGSGEGYRNGYRRKKLKSSEGEISYANPQLRGTRSEALEELRKRLSGRSGELERLAVEMYARGCSTRDIESIFSDEDGRSLLSRTAVSEVTEVLWKEYEEFATRDLSEVQPLYLFVDGIAERLRPGAKREAVLAAWAITWDKRKVLVHLSPGTKESTDCCREFFQDMKRRGLGDPVLVATDGAPGLIRATEECFPQSHRQRCLAHRMRNLMAKLPEEIHAEFKQAAKASYEAPSPAMAKALRDDLVKRFESDYPSAVRCFLEDFGACTAHLQCPPAHRRYIRTTNLLERLFEEERRRMRPAGTMFGERAVLKLMYAALIRGAERWRGIKITDFEKRQLQAVQGELLKKHRKENEPAAKTENRRETARSISSRNRT